MYNFTLLTVQLNEPEKNIAPTDSRLRPDQRLMEENDWDRANEEKVRLEEKQREKRAIGETEYKPTWFNKTFDTYSNGMVFTYNNEYWKCKSKQNWQNCPNIF